MVSLKQILRPLSVVAAALSLAAAVPAGTGLTSSVPAAQAQSPVNYVALGDSFTSSGSLVGMGTGLELGSFGSAAFGPASADSRGQTSCMRSTDGYPRQLAAMTGWQLTDVSCRGARVPLMTQHSAEYGSPQLDFLTPDADLVSLQLGGNDTDVFHLAGTCMTTADCSYLEPEWSAKVPAVAPELRALIGEIRARAPHAQVVLVGYLQPFAPVPCVDIAPFSAANQGFGRRHVDRLNDMLRGVARDTGVDIVADVTPPGHSACDPDRWTSFLGVDANAVPLHPTHAGHAAVAQMIRDVARV